MRDSHKFKKKKKKQPKKFLTRSTSTRESVLPLSTPVVLLPYDTLKKKIFREIESRAEETVSFFSAHLLLFTLILIIFSGILLFVTFQKTDEIEKNRVFAVLDTVPRAAPYPAYHESDIFVSTFSYIVFEKDSRVVIASKNDTTRLLPASTAKIMTGLVALEHYTLDEVLTAHDLYNIPGSKMGLLEGEKIKVRDLLYGLLLPSGNDAAYVLAQSYPGGVSGFVAKMNEKARALHLENTNFIDPAGYEDGNIASASDLARLGAEALDNREMRKIVATTHATVYDVSFSHSHALSNLNELLAIPGVIGIKTGFTDEAGGVLVTAYTRGEGTYILCVMRSTDRFADTRALLDDVVAHVNLISY